jgi:class 3 adenylate cyclase/tetratricopeptide (TPR) repeat protein
VTSGATSGPPGTGTGPLSCPICGTPAVSGARFCHACGAALGSGAGASPDSGGDAERRVVTVLFGDLSDFTSWSEDLDPERVGVVTDRVLTALARTVTDFGGHVDKLTGDGIMAVFGAPTAHEDDAERAVRAAARMQESVRRLVADESGGGRRLGLRVGLNTGEVLAGRQAGLAYTVIGDTVNTAARLSDAAGVGAVIAGRETVSSSMTAASWRSLSPLRLKGKREPVAAYELVALRTSGSRRLGLGDEAPFVGREGEFGLLVGRLLDLVDAGPRAEPHTVVVTGEAGVGKTRLVREFSRFAGEVPGSRVLWSRCAPYGDGRDLSPIRQLVRTGCGIEEEDGRDVATAKVRRAAARLDSPSYGGALPAVPADALLSLLGLLETTADLGLPPEGASPGVPAAGRDPGVSVAAALLSSYAAEGPLLVVIDDLHWASPAFIDALLLLTRRLSGQVLLVGIGRPDLFTLREGWVSELPDPEGLPLAPLDRGAAERLLRAYLGGVSPEASASDLLLDRAAGNPFFLAELLHLLVERGLLRETPSGWHLTGDLPEEVLPAGVQAVLAARIDGLDPRTKAVLRDAAVVGVVVGQDALVAVSGGSSATDRAEVTRALESLSARGLLQAGPDSSYVFEHPLARDVAYTGIPKAERARRHAAVARWAESATLPQPGDADRLVTAHGERALALADEMGLPPGDPARAVRGVTGAALLRLGQAALARDDNLGAEALLARALRLLDEEPGGEPSPLLPAARVARARALASLRRDEEALTELAPVETSTEPEIRSSALVVLGQVRRQAGEDDEATVALEAALACASAPGLERVAGEALRQLGLLDYFAGRLRSAERRYAAALELAERVGDPRGAGWALQQLAWSATSRGDYPTADAALDRAADVFTELEDDGGLAWCMGTEGFVRLLQGRFSEARDLAGSLLSTGGTGGDPWGISACLTIDAFAAAELGDMRSAIEESARARGIFAEVGDAWGEAMALIAQGVGARGAGDLDGAVALLGEAVRLSENGLHPVTEGLSLVILGLASLDRGDLDAAEAAALRGQSLLAGLDLEPHAEVGTKVLLAQVRRARGDLAGALSLLEEVTAAVDEPTLLFPRRQALAHQAGVLLAMGRKDEALELARRSVSVPAQDVRSRVVALRGLGNAEAAVGETELARVRLVAALTLARETGPASEVAPTERALAALN